MAIVIIWAYLAADHQDSCFPSTKNTLFVGMTNRACNRLVNLCEGVKQRTLTVCGIGVDAAAHINKLVRKVSHDCRQANRSNVEGCLCSYRPTLLHNYLVLTSSTILHSTYIHYMQQCESRIWKSSHNMLDMFML